MATVIFSCSAIIPTDYSTAYAAQSQTKTSSIKLSKSKITFSANKKSAKVKITTSYSRYGLTYRVLSGASNVSCSWAKNWSGNSINLNIKSKKSGGAKIKVWVTGYPKKSKIITVKYSRGYKHCYEEDNYKIGRNMPAGEYVVFAYDDSGYVCISEDSNQNEIIENENFDYNVIVQVRDGDFFEISRAYAVPISEAKVQLNRSGSMYKVGYHIAPGEYTLKKDGAYGGYYAVMKGPIGSERNNYISNIIDNDNFDGSRAYVTVESGQYLLTTRCKGNFVAPANPIKLEDSPNYTTKLPANSKFNVSLPSLPYMYEFNGMLDFSVKAKVNEIETKKLYNPKTGKYAFYCTAYGKIEYTGIHSIVLTLYDAFGNEIENSADFIRNEGHLSESYSIDQSLKVENLDEGEYILKLEII